MYVIVRETERAYSLNERKLPFRRLRLTTRVTPNLDPPEDSEPVDDGDPQKAFWPRVGGEPFPFHFVAEDWEGRPCEFVAPLLFIGRDGLADEKFVEKALAAYAEASQEWRECDLHGQRVAFADTTAASRGKTTLETVQIELGAEVRPGDPPFTPTVTAASVRVPAVEHLVGTSAPLEIEIDKGYVDKGWTGNARSGLRHVRSRRR